MYHKSFTSPTLDLCLALWGLSNIPLARADCVRDSFGNCYHTFNVAWITIAIGVFFLALVLGSYARYKKRQRANAINLAFIANTQAMNNQAQWQAQNQAYVPPYAHGGGYDPTNAGAYHTPSNTGGELPKYPLPPGAPQSTGSYSFPHQSSEPTPGGGYQAPQYPPPTYAAKA